MIPKKGFCVTRLVKRSDRTVGGIVLPQRNELDTEAYVVLSVNGESDLSVGDVVLFAPNPNASIGMEFNGEKTVIRPLDDALAIVGHENVEYCSVPFSAAEAPEIGSSVHGVGEKVVIAGRRISGVHRVGSLFVTYERRELGRANYGPVASLSDSLSEKTGIVPGVYVLYDYHSTFGHFDGFDVTNEENVIAMLDESEVRHLDEGGRS